VELLVDDKFFQQKYGLDMESSVSPIDSKIYMECFEKRLILHDINHL
jgi:hypothetical protein